ncbi:DUF4974 domain-containing protein [Chitinophaga silvatica]|uniref:DUF4974 domain-containing protein n=1 Tax=Chitinophaga silvatica TaxID=2282649 RepID=A0A3E1Y2U7_9BACT|nr:FecR domain-containing protein [Chitinophaga silvatica]RFS19030.1 DUF4974 domain-containing protein [Chitinophaga silvatica]
MEHNNYHLFTKEDFLEDTRFLEWVRYAHPEASTFWEAYQQSNPPNLEALQQARMMLLSIYSMERITPPTRLKASLWTDIQQELKSVPVVKLVPKRRIWWAAAILLPLGILTAYIIKERNATKVIASNYGELLKFRLPDSTLVQLNANSEISYKNWGDGKREIWLKGEALFEVTTIHPIASPFTVFAGDVKVEVLGTTFNIKERREEVAVFLKEGKVRVSTFNGDKSVVLQPGEYLKFTKEKTLVPQGKAKAENMLSWTDHKLQLHETSVRDILTALQDTYGYNIILEDGSLADRKINGTLSINHLNNVLFELSTILNVKIEKSNDTLTFRNTGQHGY